MREILINIDVPDLDAGIRFYEKGLGFALQRLLFDGTVAELAGGGSRIFLIGSAAGTAPVKGSPLVRAYDDHWTPVHLDIAVDDLDAALSGAVAAGARIAAAVTSHEWGRIAGLRDPFGNGLCLIQFSTAGYDAVATDPAPA